MAAISDAEAMRAAVTLGERGRLSAPPNPWVGSVIVRGGEVIGRGFHRQPGEPHGEVVALAEAGDAARGATLYTTLEPCVHHGRTPPCADALLAAGVRRVVAGVVDPDPKVRGGGVERLRHGGVDVEVGIEREAVEESLLPYLHQRETGRPWCVLKSAVSIDGRPVAMDGSSQWITGADARADVHRVRARSQAIVVGAGTAIADQPALTVRDADPPREPPLRVVLDARARVPAEGPLFEVERVPTLVITAAHADPLGVSAWKAAGAEVEEVATDEPHGVALDAALDLLGRRGVLQVLVEGGPTLSGALLGRELVDEVIVYVGGAFLGDQARSLAEGLAVPALHAAHRWQLVGAEAVGGDARMVWRR